MPSRPFTPASPMPHSRKPLPVLALVRITFEQIIAVVGLLFSTGAAAWGARKVRQGMKNRRDREDKLDKLAENVGEALKRLHAMETALGDIGTEVRVSSARGKALAAIQDVPCWEFDAKDGLAEANPALLALLSCEPEDLEGDGWHEFIHSDDRRRVLTRWERTIRDGGNYTDNEPIRLCPRRGACNILVTASATPVRDAAGNILSYIGVWRVVDQEVGHG